MAEEATISVTCKKVFSSHKLTNVSKKSKGNMILPIEERESHNSVSRKVMSATRKMITMALPTSKTKSPFFTLTPKEVMLASRNQKLSPTPDKATSITLPQVQKVSWLAECIVNGNHTTQNCQLTSCTLTKIKSNFSNGLNK